MTRSRWAFANPSSTVTAQWVAWAKTQGAGKGLNSGVRVAGGAVYPAVVDQGRIVTRIEQQSLLRRPQGGIDVATH